MTEDSLIRRDQLPLPAAYVEPRTPTEIRLAKIWATALDMDRVGVEDNYLDLGVDSLHAEVICELIEEAFGIAFPLAVFPETDNVAALASKIDVARSADEALED